MSLLLNAPLRVGGTAVFLNAEKGATPFALLQLDATLNRLNSSA